MSTEKPTGNFLMENKCKTCGGKEPDTAVQIYPSQVWEYYCRKCYEKNKKTNL